MVTLLIFNIIHRRKHHSVVGSRLGATGQACGCKAGYRCAYSFSSMGTVSGWSTGCSFVNSGLTMSAAGMLSTMVESTSVESGGKKVVQFHVRDICVFGFCGKRAR